MVTFIGLEKVSQQLRKSIAEDIQLQYSAQQRQKQQEQQLLAVRIAQDIVQRRGGMEIDALIDLLEADLIIAEDAADDLAQHSVELDHKIAQIMTDLQALHTAKQALEYYKSIIEV